MSNTRAYAVGVLGAVLAFGVFGGFSGLGHSGPSDPEAAVPKGTFIAATVDFEELRRSPLYDAMIGRDPNDPLKKQIGVSSLGEACGFDPTSRVRKLAVAIPEDDSERGAFGVVAHVEVTGDELEKCTTALAAKHGGKMQTHDVGSFVVLDDPSKGGYLAPALAYGRGGLLVVGKGKWFDAMLAAADRKAPSLKDSADHTALRNKLTSYEGFHSPTLVLTAILPKATRERIKKDMSEESGGPKVEDVAMTGVLGVSAVGIALHAGGPGQNADLEIELVCDDDASCVSVEETANKKKKEMAGELLIRMTGLGPLLDSIQVKRDGTHLHATATAQVDALAATIERIVKLRQGGRGPLGGGTDRPSGSLPKRPPFEIIPAHPAGSAGAPP